MSGAELALALAALAFVAAEVAHPTHIPPKKLAAHGLVLVSQASPGGVLGALDPELLDDLPRIHPDALGDMRVTARGAREIVVSGTIADPGTRSAGAAVFALVDGVRLSGARASYGREPLPTRFTLVFDMPAPCRQHTRLAVGLVSADQRGFFLLENEPDVRVGR